MPTPAYARCLIRLNGGAAQHGAVTATSGQVVSFQLESTDGIDQQLWQIYAFPQDWTGPGGTWVFNAANNCWENYNPTPSPVTLPTIDVAWGKWLFRVTVNNGFGVPGLFDDGTAVQTLSGQGLRELAVLEGDQFGGAARSWVGDQQLNARTIDEALGGAAGGSVNNGDHPYFSYVYLGTGNPGLVTAPASGLIRVPSTAANPLLVGLDGTGEIDVPLITWQDDLDGLYFGDLNKVATVSVSGRSASLVGQAGSFSSDTDGLVARASSGKAVSLEVGGISFAGISSGGAAFLASGLTDVAASGFLRVAHNATVLTGRNGANSADVGLLSWGADGTNRLNLGNMTGVTSLFASIAGATILEATVGSGTILHSEAGQLLAFKIGGSAATGYFATGAFGLFPPGAPFDLRGGVGVLALGPRTTAPTTTAGNSSLLWAEPTTGVVHVLQIDGTTFALGAGGGGGGGISAGDNTWLTSVGSAASGVATAGFLRVKGSATPVLSARNNAATANVSLLTWDTSDRLLVGDTSTVSTALMGGVASVYGATTAALTGSTSATVGTDDIEGLTVGPSATAVFGADSISVATGNGTVLASDTSGTVLDSPTDSPQVTRIGGQLVEKTFRLNCPLNLIPGTHHITFLEIDDPAILCRLYARLETQITGGGSLVFSISTDAAGGQQALKNWSLNGSTARHEMRGYDATPTSTELGTLFDLTHGGEAKILSPTTLTLDLVVTGTIAPGALIVVTAWVIGL